MIRSLKKRRRGYKRRLVAITKSTQKALAVTARTLSKQLGVKVYPMQVAAAVIEQVVR